MNALLDDDNPEIREQTKQHYKQAKTHYTQLIQTFIDLDNQPTHPTPTQIKNLTKQLLHTRYHINQLPQHELSHLVILTLEETANKITQQPTTKPTTKPTTNQQPTQYTITRQPYKHTTTLHIYAGNIHLGTTSHYNNHPNTELDTVLDFLHCAKHTVHPQHIHFTNQNTQSPPSTSSTSTTSPEPPPETTPLRAAISAKISSN